MFFVLLSAPGRWVMCKCVLCAGRTVETHGSNETLINIVYPWNMTVTRISLFDTSHPLSCIPSVILPHSVPAGLTGVRWLILAYVSSRDCQTHSLIQAEHIHSPSPCRILESTTLICIHIFNGLLFQPSLLRWKVFSPAALGLSLTRPHFFLFQ